MANITVSEKTFAALSSAAHLAFDRGNLPLAGKLDRLARMTNAALSNARARRLPGAKMFGGAKGVTWRDVPSVFTSDHQPRKPK